MATLKIDDLPVSEELDREAMRAVHGGRIKLPFQKTSAFVGDGGGLLTTADGDPVSVYVDGVLVNNLSDGFVHL